MEAIVLAGGFGTRLKNVVNDVPKPMAPVNGKPFLTYILDFLQKKGTKKVVLCTGYLSEIIERFYGNSYKNIVLEYSVEKEPLGTGGAIKKALDYITEENVLILNGDTFFDVELDKMISDHINKNADFTLALKPMKEFDRYGTVQISQNGRVTGFEEKRYQSAGYINGGVYVIKKNIFESTDLPEKFSLESDFMCKTLSRKHFNGFVSDTYFIDIGIPEDYYKAEKDFKNLWK
jgi:D-glycero-alpha-D-manno-heptose 1-phosphate guanylyltransferase